MKYELFKKFKKENDHCNDVLKLDETYQLKHKQPKGQTNNNITESRIKKLTNFGFKLVQRDMTRRMSRKGRIKYGKKNLNYLNISKKEICYCDIPILDTEFKVGPRSNENDRKKANW